MSRLRLDFLIISFFVWIKISGSDIKIRTFLLFAFFLYFGNRIFFHPTDCGLLFRNDFIEITKLQF